MSAESVASEIVIRPCASVSPAQERRNLSNPFCAWFAHGVSPHLHCIVSARHTAQPFFAGIVSAVILRSGLLGALAAPYWYILQGKRTIHATRGIRKGFYAF